MIDDTSNDERLGIVMKTFVGLTDYDWYQYQLKNRYTEINFWRPGTTPFKILKPGEPFLFKLKKPYYSIVGGGYFVEYLQLPCDAVWERFGHRNGIESRQLLRNRIAEYRRKHHMNEDDVSMDMGCIVLSNPFFFTKEQWVRPMDDWASNIVQGKTYDTACGEGKRVYEEVLARVHREPRELSYESRQHERLETSWASLNQTGKAKLLEYARLLTMDANYTSKR